MDTYLDKKYSVIDNTLILYTGNESDIVVPKTFRGMQLRRIGSASFAELGTLHNITVPYGVTAISGHSFASDRELKRVFLPGTVKEVGLQSFDGCIKLEEIVIYDMVLDVNEYELLKNAGLKTSQNQYVSDYIPSRMKNWKLGEALPFKKAVAVPRGVNIIFISDSIGEDKGIKKLYKDSKYISFDGRTDNVWEDKIFQEHIEAGCREPVSDSSDLAADAFVKTNVWTPQQKTYIFMLDDARTKVQKDKASVTASLKFGFFFWQSAQKVICDRKDYYIYRRNYLSPDEKIEYLRSDVAVYRGKDLVTDREEAQRVYGKYKLLSLL